MVWLEPFDAQFLPHLVPKLCEVILRIADKVPIPGEPQTLHETVYVGALDKPARGFPNVARRFHHAAILGLFVGQAPGLRGARAPASFRE